MLTTAVVGAAAPAVFAGAAAPTNLAGTDVPAIAGMKLSAVAEVYSSAADAEGVLLVIRAGGSRDIVSEPIEHSVVGVPNAVGKSSVDIVTDSEPSIRWLSGDP